MITLKQEVFEVYTNSDSIEGRGHDVHIGYFKNHYDAKLAAIGRGVMGGEADIRHINLVVNVFESLEEFDSNTRENIRKRALAKLDVEERKVLGLE